MKNIDLVKALHRIWNTGDLALIDSVVDVFGSGDRVASRYVSTGTHKGAFWGIEPTGRRIEIQEISIFRIADGRIAEQWCMFDDLARLQQLGVGVEHLRKVLKI